MLDGTNLNVLQTSRQMLRAFGGLNEGYGCSEAEFSGEMNFSSRGYPALQTRKMRRNVRTVQGVNGIKIFPGSKQMPEIFGGPATWEEAREKRLRRPCAG